MRSGGGGPANLMLHHQLPWLIWISVAADMPGHACRAHNSQVHLNEDMHASPP